MVLSFYPWPLGAQHYWPFSLATEAPQRPPCASLGNKRPDVERGSNGCHGLLWGGGGGGMMEGASLPGASSGHVGVHLCQHTT